MSSEPLMQVNGKTGVLERLLLRWRRNEVELLEKQNRLETFNSLMESINKARIDWLSAISNFEQADQEELIDYYTYKIKACQVRYNFLIKKAKEMGIRK